MPAKKCLYILSLCLLANGTSAAELRLIDSLHFGGPGEELSVGMVKATDDTSSIIISSSYQGTLPFSVNQENNSATKGKSNRAEGTDQFCFVAKWNRDSDEMDWAFTIEGSGIHTPARVTVLADGDYLITPNPKGYGVLAPVDGPEATFETAISAPDYTFGELYPTNDAMVGYLRSDGVLRNYDLVIGSLSNFAQHSQPKADGGAYIIGTTRREMIFNEGLATEQTLPAPFGEYDSLDGYIASYDHDGTVQWLRRIGGGDNIPGQMEEDDTCSDIALFPNDDFVVVGFGRSQFAANLFRPDEISASLKGDKSDIFAGRWDENGNLLWLQTYGGFGSDVCRAVETLPDGDFIMTGSFSDGADFLMADGTIEELETRGDFDQDIYIARCSGDDGRVQWINTFGSTAYDSSYGIDITPDGSRVVVVGEYSGDLFYENTLIAQNQGAGDGLILVMDTVSGEYESHASIQGSGFDALYEAIAIDNQTIAALGNFETTASVNTGTNNAVYTTSGDRDGLVVVMDFDDRPSGWLIN